MIRRALRHNWSPAHASVYGGELNLCTSVYLPLLKRAVLRLFILLPGRHLMTRASLHYSHSHQDLLDLDWP